MTVDQRAREPPGHRSRFAGTVRPASRRSARGVRPPRQPLGEPADLVRRHPAAAADEPGPSGQPAVARHRVDPAGPRPRPGPSRRVPALAAVRVDDDREGRARGDAPDELVDVLGRGAVDADGEQSPRADDGGDRLLDGDAAPQVCPVRAGERDPGGRVVRLGEEPGDRDRLLQLGDRLEREDVRAGRGEDRQALAVVVTELGDGAAVPSAVLRSVREQRAVRADRCRDEQGRGDGLLAPRAPPCAPRSRGPRSGA